MKEGISCTVTKENLERSIKWMKDARNKTKVSVTCLKARKKREFLRCAYIVSNVFLSEVDKRAFMVSSKVREW